MSRAKRFGLRPEDRGSLNALAAAFQDSCLTLIGRHEGRSVTGCLVLLHPPAAFYWRAATNEEGRAVSAAYAMILELLENLRVRGITRLDFGGITPPSARDPGVSHFKRGFGGRSLEYLGELEWATSPGWRRAVNFLVRIREGK